MIYFLSFFSNLSVKSFVMLSNVFVHHEMTAIAVAVVVDTKNLAWGTIHWICDNNNNEQAG
jgi:hypothetical protein